MSAPDEMSLTERTMLAVKDEWTAPLLHRITALEENLRRMCDAIREIEEIAADNVDLDAHSWNSVWHICQTAVSRRHRAEAEVPSQESP